MSLCEHGFVRDTVLLLGKELDGIPAPLLAMLDACVEIPQAGILRSLNVHVAGAVTLYEYVRQARGRAQPPGAAWG